MTIEPPSADPAKPILSTDDKIRAMLEEIRPYLQRDGGDCEFVSYENRVVNIKLHGACGSCPSSLMTLRMGIEGALREQVPEIEAVNNVDQPNPVGPGHHPGLAH